jgi:hypothetical protein
MDPQEPRLFETLTLPNVAALCFVIRVADTKIRPELVPTPGTAYSACLLPTRIGVQEWGTYVYGFPQEAPAGYSAYVFLPSLPTAPVVATRQDEIWGPVLDHSYYALRSAGIPDIADTNVAALGTPGNGRFVQRVQIQEVSSLVALLTVTTTAAATVTQTDKPVDRESGSLFTQTRVFTLATTSPTGTALNSSGEYTESTQQGHNLYVTTTSQVPGTLNLVGNKKTYTEDTNAPFIWPAVLTNFATTQAVINPSETEAVDTLATYSIKNAYSGPVKCEVEEYWQLTSPTTVANAQMQPQSINIEGLRYPVNIPPCLTAGITYAKRIFNVSTSTWQTMTVTVAATSNTDWPATVITYNVRPIGGGYLIEKRTWYKPTGYTGGTTVTVA